MRRRVPSSQSGQRPITRASASAPLWERAVKAHQTGHLQEAIKIYNQILTTDPTSPRTLTYCGAALLACHHTDEAARILQTAVSLDPDNVEALCFLGNALQMTGRFAAAEKNYRQALAIRPRYAKAHNNLGVVLQYLRRDQEAAERFRQAVEIEPCYAQAYNNLSQVLLKLGDVENAIAAGVRAVEIDPRYAEGYNTYGSALSKAGRVDAAITIYQKALRLQPDFLSALTNIAVAFIIARRMDEAVDACDRALSIDPGNVSALTSKSVALSEQKHRAALSHLVDFDRYIRSTLIDPANGFANLAQFNQALVQHICTHPSLAYEPAGKATRQGRHTGDLLREPKGPIGALEPIINRAIEDYLGALPDDPTHPVVATAPSSWRLSVWSVVLEQAGHQVPHIHEAGWLSGVYYAKVPASIGVTADNPAGWIEFGRPQDLYRTERAPELRLIKPREGLMILFPSYFFHRTVPTGNQELRVSIAFDVIRKDG